MTIRQIILVAIFVVAVSFQGNVPQQQPKMITLTVSVTDAELIIKALGKLPYEETAALINSVYGQANKQLAPPATQKADSTNKKKQLP